VAAMKEEEEKGLVKVEAAVWYGQLLPLTTLW